MEKYLLKEKLAKSHLAKEVAKAINDIVMSSTSKEARAALSDIKIVKVIEVDVESTGKKALVITVPYVQFKTQIKPNQGRVVAELEKKTKLHVIVTALRTLLKPSQIQVGHRKRPVSRTLTKVHAALIEDIVGPADICGRHTRINADGSQVLKIQLDPKDRTKDNIEEKLATFGDVYKALTRKTAIFEFAEYTL